MVYLSEYLILPFPYSYVRRPVSIQIYSHIHMHQLQYSCVIYFPVHIHITKIICICVPFIRYISLLMYMYIEVFKHNYLTKTTHP